MCDSMGSIRAHLSHGVLDYIIIFCDIPRKYADKGGTVDQQKNSTLGRIGNNLKALPGQLAYQLYYF